jgi:hypothetical protein
MTTEVRRMGCVIEERGMVGAEVGTRTADSKGLARASVGLCPGWGVKEKGYKVNKNWIAW